MTSSELNISLSLTSSSQRIPLTIKSNVNAVELHEQVSSVTNVPKASLKLIYRGRLISNKEEEEDVVQKYKLEDGCVIHCMGKPTSTATDVAAAANSNNNNNPTTTTTATLAMALRSFQVQCGTNHDKYVTALKTLSKILENIVANPTEEKYRKLKCSNAAFSKRLGSEAKDVLLKCGFDFYSEGGEEDYFLITPSAEKWEWITQAKTAVDQQLLLVSSTSATTTATGPAFRNNVPSSTVGNINTPMMQNVLNDPNAFSSMLSDPMVQQAMENDPRFASNPMARQAIRAMQQNPAMVEQMARMMSDPAIRSQMEALQQNPAMVEQMLSNPMMRSQMMEAMQQQPAAATQQQQQNPARLDRNALQQAMAAISQQTNNNNSNNNNEQELTEEEMIQEAIRRSLED